MNMIKQKGLGSLVLYLLKKGYRSIIEAATAVGTNKYAKHLVKFVSVMLFVTLVPYLVFSLIYFLTELPPRYFWGLSVLLWSAVMYVMLGLHKNK